MEEASFCRHDLFSPAGRTAGAQGSTAEVEDELLALWDSVEKDKAAARERAATAAGTVRVRRRRAGRGGAGVAAAGRWKKGNTASHGCWQQLQARPASSLCDACILRAGFLLCHNCSFRKVVISQGTSTW